MRKRSLSPIGSDGRNGSVGNFASRIAQAGFQPLDRHLASVPQIYGALREMILKLDLKPGEPIIKDDVAQAFEVSPMPVREALRKLEEEGLVAIKPQSGTFVTPINIRLAREAQFLRIGVEIEVIHTVVSRISDDELHALESILAHQEQEYQARRKDAFTKDDALFHATLYEIAGVGGLWERIGFMRAHIDRLRAMHLPVGRKMEMILADHLAILESIRGKNAAKAETAMRDHLSGTLAAIDNLRTEFPEYF